MSPASFLFEEHVKKLVRQFSADVEKALQELMQEEGMTENDLRERAVMVHHPDGRITCDLDGVSRLEWRVSFRHDETKESHA